MSPHRSRPFRQTGPQNLVQGTLRTVALLSTAIVLAVLLLALVVVSLSVRDSLIRDSGVVSDEIASILVDPLYAVDDAQAKRIADIMVSLGKVSGIRLESNITGILFDHRRSELSQIPSQRRDVVRKGQKLGTVTVWFSDDQLVGSQRLLLLVSVLLVGAVAGANLLAHRLIVRKRVEDALSEIAEGIDRIGRGQYDRTIGDTQYQDVNAVVSLINGMASRIDLTSRDLRSTVEELTRSQALFQSVFDSASEAIIGTDPGGTVIFFNRGAERILGYPAKEIIGLHTPLMWHVPREVEHAQQVLEGALGREVTPFQALTLDSTGEPARDRREWTWVAQDGTYRTVRLGVTPLLEAESGRQGFLGVARDITSLREVEHRAGTIMQRAPFGVLVAEEWVEFANPAFARIFGLGSPSEAQGKRPSDFVAEADRGVFEAFGQARLAGEPGPAPLEVRGTHPDLGEIVLGVRIEGIRLGGRPSQLIFWEDITERKRAEVQNRELAKNLETKVLERTEELRLAYQRLETAQQDLVTNEKLTALGQLAAGIAHELNTPLGAITSSASSIQTTLTEALPGTVDYLRDLSDAERGLFWTFVRWCSTHAQPLAGGAVRERKKALQGTLESQGIEGARRLASLLSDLGAEAVVDALPDLIHHPRCLDLVDQAGALVSAFTLAQVVEVAAQKGSGVVSALRQYLKNEPPGALAQVEVERDLEIVLTLLQGKVKNRVRVERQYAGVKVWGSSAGLSQVWMNLITNAVQAMDYNGTLTLTTAYQGDLVVVSVADTGPGMSPEVRERIFEPFFTTKAPGDGMGLGLDICRKIVGDHRGKILVETRPGRTVFTVQLPAPTLDTGKGGEGTP
jgi:PAS domain S-box-containing protein